MDDWTKLYVGSEVEYLREKLRNYQVIQEQLLKKRDLLNSQKYKRRGDDGWSNQERLRQCEGELKQIKKQIAIVVANLLTADSP